MSAFWELHELEEDSIDVSNVKAWRKEQLRRLWLLIGMAFTGETGIGKQWRMQKCYQILRKRFWRLETCDWIPFIAGFSDCQTIGTIRNQTLQRDLIRIRDTALKTCKNWNQKVI